MRVISLSSFGTWRFLTSMGVCMICFSLFLYFFFNVCPVGIRVRLSLPRENTFSVVVTCIFCAIFIYFPSDVYSFDGSNTDRIARALFVFTLFCALYIIFLENNLHP